jgi:hypothetical protein
VLETLKIARHVAVDERDPDAGVNRKPTVLSSDHVAHRIGVEEPLYAEPQRALPNPKQRMPQVRYDPSP